MLQACQRAALPCPAGDAGPPRPGTHRHCKAFTAERLGNGSPRSMMVGVSSFGRSAAVWSGGGSRGLWAEGLHRGCGRLGLNTWVAKGAVAAIGSTLQGSKSSGRWERRECGNPGRWGLQFRGVGRGFGFVLAISVSDLGVGLGNGVFPKKLDRLYILALDILALESFCIRGTP
ncbi:MAG: hypothetical protein JWO30_1480 [Fibrobacteres bacterium]|nr:hypothetical protein [Fibrobacterota bacterium]